MNAFTEALPTARRSWDRRASGLVLSQPYRSSPNNGKRSCSTESDLRQPGGKSKKPAARNSSAEIKRRPPHRAPSLPSSSILLRAMAPPACVALAPSTAAPPAGDRLSRRHGPRQKCPVRSRAGLREQRLASIASGATRNRCQPVATHAAARLTHGCLETTLSCPGPMVPSTASIPKVEAPHG